MGIPTAYIPRSQNTTFNVESPYWDIDCYNITHGRLIALDNSGLDSEIAPLEQNSSYVGSNGAEACTSQEYFCSLSLGISSVILGAYLGTPQMAVKSGVHIVNRTLPTILFQFPFSDQGLFNVIRAFCQISQAYVESVVNCSFPESAAHPNCRVSSVCESMADHPPPYLTDLSFWGVIGNWASSLAASYGGQKDGSMGYTAIQSYLLNAPLGFIPDSSEHAGPDPMFNITTSTFSERLSHVLNTYWLGSILPQAMMGDFASIPIAPHRAAASRSHP